MQNNSLNLDSIRLRFSTSKGIPLAETAELQKETLRYLYLTSKGKQMYSCLSSAVDEYWHELILHTQIYSEYCKDNYGGMIHHLPESYSNLQELTRAQKSYSEFLEDYQAEFSEQPPAHIWPRAFDPAMAVGCKGCNGCAGPIPAID